MQFVVKSVCVYIYIYMYIHSIHMHIRLHAVYVYIVTYVSYIYTYVTISTYVYTHIRTAQALNPKAPKSPTLRESGDHPIKLERYREDWHGPCARMTRTNREVYQVNGHPSTCRFAGDCGPSSSSRGQSRRGAQNGGFASKSHGLGFRFEGKDEAV